jgi:hypothetical protein
MRPIRSVSVLAALIGLPALALADDCKFSAQRDFDVDAAGLRTLALDSDASDVVVEGVAGLSRVEVRGKACASDPAWLDDLKLGQQRSADRLTVTAKTDRHGNAGLFGSSYAYLELRVRVPAAFAVEIDGSSADADVDDVAELRFQTASGDLTVHRIAGTLTTKSASGDVEGGDIGRVEVRSTASGDIALRDVRGDVHVGSSGSGDLEFDNVGGSVVIGSVGSGDVELSHVDRDAGVEAIGSGDVSAEDIGGNFTVRHKGSGDVSHHGVRGTVSVPDDD